MRVILVAVALILPLVIAPGILFFGDVTPKVMTALLAAGACLAYWTVRPAPLASLAASGRGRRFLFCVAAWAAVTLITTVSARSPELAWGGSTWRGFGALVQIALLVVAVAVAAESHRDPGFVAVFCRALCVSGTIAATYGILQYAGIDPLLSGMAYHAGEGPFRIVRPPSTLGHADYFAAFLLWPAFAGVYVRGRIGWAAVISAAVAIVLSGSRGALLGLIAGAICWIALTRPRRRTVALSATAAVALFTVFTVSPAGAKLRARLHWIGEEPAGGARLLLWRDTLGMIAGAPVLGYGRENFVAEFPQYQSVELARAYPDFYHESPHNLLLDAFASEGIMGLAALLALVGLAARRWMEARRPGSGGAPAMLSGLAAALVAHQFIVLTPATAFCFLAAIGFLAVEHSENEPAARTAFAMRLSFLVPAQIAAASAAVFLVFTAARTGSRDYALAGVRRDLDGGRAVAAATRYERLHYRPVAAEVYMSRRFAAAAKEVPTAIAKLWLVHAANRAAERGTRGPEQRSNAWYNLAAFAATSNDLARTEFALRQAVRYAPNWFKPHWAMARVMQASGRPLEADAEARRAIELDAGKDEEVAATLSFARASR